MILADVQPPNSTPGCPAIPLPTPGCGCARTVELERELRHVKAAVRVLTAVAGRREDERAKHRDAMAAAERRIAELMADSEGAGR